MSKVNAIEAEKLQVSELLQGVIVVDEAVAPANESLPPASGSVLDRTVLPSAFLRVVITRVSWAREELEAVAR